MVIYSVRQKYDFLLFFRQRCFKFFLYAFATQSESVFFLVFVAHFLNAVTDLPVRALEHLAQVVERNTVVVVQDIIREVSRRCEVVAVASFKKILELVAKLRCYRLCDAGYLGVFP